MSELDVAIEKMHGAIDGVENWLLKALSEGEVDELTAYGTETRFQMLRDRLSELKAVIENERV